MGHDNNTPIARCSRLRGHLKLGALAAVLGLSACLPGIQEEGFINDDREGHDHGAAREADSEALRSTVRRCIDLTVDVEQMLTEYCSSCHGNGNSEGGIESILDVADLIAKKKLVPGDAEASKLFVLVRDGVMPKSEHKPSRAEIAMLGEWIRCGAMAFEQARDAAD